MVNDKEGSNLWRLELSDLVLNMKHDGEQEEAQSHQDSTQQNQLTSIVKIISCVKFDFGDDF